MDRANHELDVGTAQAFRRRGRPVRSRRPRAAGQAQSAVSTAVGLLEADLGVELFDRSRRNATLTPAGEVLLQEALELLRQADGLQQRALSFASGQEARLSWRWTRRCLRWCWPIWPEIAERFPALELTQLNGTATEVADYGGRPRQPGLPSRPGRSGSSFRRAVSGPRGPGRVRVALASAGRPGASHARRPGPASAAGDKDGGRGRAGAEPDGLARRQLLQHREHGRGWPGLGHPAAEHRRIRGLPRPARERALRGPCLAAAVGAGAMAAGRRAGAAASWILGRMEQLLRAGG